MQEDGRTGEREKHEAREALGHCFLVQAEAETLEAAVTQTFTSPSAGGHTEELEMYKGLEGQFAGHLNSSGIDGGFWQVV